MLEEARAAEAIARRFGFAEGGTPESALVLGSGLGSMAKGLSGAVSVDYGEIPGFPAATALSHEGRLYCGEFGGKRVLALSGRFHTYEGLSPRETAFYVRALRLLGVKRLFLTNAAGYINPRFSPGDLMAVSDHLCFFQVSPCRGGNDDALGPRFFDMSSAYSPALRKIAKACAERLGFSLEEGVYAFMPGPQYETPAEIRALRLLGADAVGMSTVPEVIEAAHCGLETLCLSCLTNPAAGVSARTLDEREVVETAAQAAGKTAALLAEIVREAG